MAAMEVQMEFPSSRRQGNQQQIPAPHLPASPTLTNPDMILPDYDRPVSPGVDLDDARIHSPLTMWKNVLAAGGGAGNDLGQFQFFGSSLDQNHPDHPYGPTGPITPTTPIIYGNGTMLSDIGEVTEVESTPGRRSPARLKSTARHRQQSPTRGSGSDGALRSSPTMPFESIKKRSSKNVLAQRERRDSMESTSTITTMEKPDLFADFDDSVSVDDTVFQGDDEESVAESYLEPEPAHSTARLGVPVSDNLDRLSISSSSSLSRRAEEILANAKKKLTTMEGNLTRARSSHIITSPSRSSFGSESTPSPTGKRASTAAYRREAAPESPTHSPGHSRIVSDNVHGLASVPRTGTQRSASALGVSGGYRQPVMASRSTEPMRNSLDSEQRRGSGRISPHSRDPPGLGPLTEDVADSNQHSGDVTPPSAKLEQFLSPTFGSFGSNGVQRSASVAQVRDLKDQVQDLKGKISSLREQARVDSLKRRSLQSLRTPSPFTHAQVDQWYAEPKPSRLSTDFDSGNGSAGINPRDGETSGVDGNDKAVGGDAVKEESAEDEDSVYTENENQTQLRPPTSHSTRRNVVEHPPEAVVEEVPEAVEEEDDDDDAISDMHTENGDMDDDIPDNSALLDDEAYESESGESLYHDTLQHPISHEDREDAFDYEHFFLHSAMGTISQQRLARRGSRSSYASEDSVETTRGPITETNSNGTGSPPPIRRRNSDASISTIGTFATAREGSGGSTPAEERPKDFPAQVITMPFKKRSDSPESAGRSTFAGSIRGHDHASRPSAVARHSIASFKSIPEEDGKENEDPFANFDHRMSVTRRPMSSSATASIHRPSVSSFESTGTTRSFPLVNRAKKANSVGMLTPQSSSPDQELRDLSDSLLNETASICEQQQQRGREMDGSNADELKHDRNRGRSIVSFANGAAARATTPQAMQALLREDQYVVERLVANLGRCVLGLTESGKASAESRMYRRRIDAARRILEGLDQV